MSSKIKINKRIREAVLSIACAILLSLSFPAFNLSFLSCVAFIPLFFVIESASPKRAFLFSYICGVIFFLITIFWLTNVTPIGWFVLCLYLGLYFAFFGLISNIFSRSKNNWMLLFALPCLWVSLEFIRSHLFSGFGWNSLGYCQFKNLSLIQIADFSGVYGVSFFVLFINCGLWIIIKNLSQEKEKDIIKFLLVLILVFSAGLIYGLTRLSKNFSEPNHKLKISVVQPNIAQYLKWDPSARYYILETLAGLSNLAGKDNPDMIIWPESAVPDFLTDDAFDFVEVFELAKAMDKPLLTGAVKYSQDEYYNSALLISREGKIIKEYDKLHLVPYGEFIPFRRFTPYLAAVVGIGDFTAGKDYTLFNISNINNSSGDIKFGVLICFEDAFSNLSREFVKRGASFLVNITNDAWFGQSAQPQQHLSQTVFRAVENRAEVVRCANTGISGLVDARGKVLKLVRDSYGENIFISGFATFQVEAKSKQNTFYCLYGDWFAYICIGMSLLSILTIILKIKTGFHA